MKFLRLTLSAILLQGLLAGSLVAQTQSNRTTGARQSSTGARGTGVSRTGGANSSYGSSTRQYRSNTMLGDAVIQVDPESRSIIVVTDEKTHNEMSKVIQELDNPKPQVLIKVVFVEVSLNKGLDLGVEGAYHFTIGNGVPLISGSANTVVITKDANGNSTTTTTSAPNSVANNGTATFQSLFGLASAAAANGGQGTVATVTASNWSATINALASKGDLKVLSRPEIMARNNQEAVIVVGQEIPFITNSQTTDTGTINNTVQYRDIGIILRVTPFITAEKSVEMIVNPEISSLSDQTIPVSNNVNAAVINKRSAETVVVTPNATTIVIGGMMQKQKTSTLKKVPLLGDIPVLGLPFRHTVMAEQKTELLIFLTPYIVDNPNKLRDLTVREANQSELSREAFSPEDIKKNLDPLLLLPMEEALPAPKQGK
jgi:general secretion pathway protein D